MLVARLGAASHVQPLGGPRCREGGDERIVIAQIAIERQRKEVAARPAGGVAIDGGGLADEDELLGVWDGQRAQQHRVGHGEDRDAGADADGERRRGGDRETRVAPHRPQRVTTIAADDIEPGARSHGADLLGDLREPAQLEEGGAPCLILRVSRAHLLVDQELQIGAQLFVQLAISVPSAHSVVSCSTFR